MKKIISLFLTTAILLISNIPVFATEKTEIEFSVGDETLLINKAPLTVVKPYVVGVGVTLVPVRVITEAFGAKVGWIEESETVTLEYEDINITLQIGNIIATVNGKEENLLSAPELTNSSTMVPLRFISEKFGASVSYNEETERITVVKEIFKSEDKEEIYINKEMNFSLYIPDNLSLSPNSSENIIRFYDDSKSGSNLMLEFSVYYKEISTNAKTILNKHRENNLKYIRETSVKEMGLVKESFNKYAGYEYIYELDTVKGKCFSFENEGYIYIVENRGIDDKTFDKIINSIEVKKPVNVNNEKLKFNKENITFLYDESITDIKITLPNSYKKLDNQDYKRFEYEEYTEFVRGQGNVVFRCAILDKRDDSDWLNETEYYLDKFVKQDFKDKLVSVKTTEKFLIGNIPYIGVEYVLRGENGLIYCEEYETVKDGIRYRFEIEFPAHYYSEEVKQEIYNALGRIY